MLWNKPKDENKVKGWDKTNKPIGYIIGVSPGFASMEPSVENRLRYMGMARKITKAARLGFEFAMIDFEELGEAYEPEIARQIRTIREAQNIEIGIHLPVAIDLCIAYAFEWRYFQDQLKIGARAARDGKAKFILFHSSSHMRPNITAAFLGRREAPGKLVGPDGTNFGNWIIKNGMKDWFMAKFIRVMFSAMGVAGDPAVIDYFEEKESFSKAKKYAENAYRRGAAIREEELMKIRARVDVLERIRRDEELGGRKMTPEEIKEYQMLLLEYKEKSTYEYLIKKVAEVINSSEEHARRCISVAEYTIRYDFDAIFNYWLRQGSEGEEYVAYLTVAEHMFRNNDKLWSAVSKVKRSPYMFARESSKKLGALTMAELDKLKSIVTAVAAKYIEGHLFTKAEQYAVKENGKYKSVYDFCKDNKMIIYIETAMPEKGAEGELRIIKATDQVKICKAIDGGNIINYCIDFEHLLTNLIDPIKEAEELLKNQPGDGKYITCLHTNAPRPIMGAHAPLERFSYDLYIIYKWIYTLRKAGMKNSYIILEMGSYGVKQSAIAFRNIVNELLKDPPTKPEDLPKEFFGIDKEFEAREMIAMREHAFDPLKGVMAIPEEEWTMVGRRAAERGRAAEWERRKYR